MIIKTINNDYKTVNRRKGDLHTQTYTKNEKYHPFIAEREYIRALNATKIERLLAKPFINAFSSHKEGIIRVEKHLSKDLFLASSFDGTTILYDIENMKIESKLVLNTHSKGVSFLHDNILISNKNHVLVYDSQLENELYCFKTNGYINFISARDDFVVSTTGGIETYDREKMARKAEYEGFSCDFAVFDPYSNLIGAAHDNKIVLVENRVDKEVSRFEIGTKTNYLSFSPNGRYFVSANEDHNVYLHDLRFMERPVGVFRHHVNAVTAVDYNPAGSEIATASYDKTVRIFKTTERKSRDVYYNKRMYHVSGVKYTSDGSRIVSGSNDGSLRVWKSEASTKLGETSRREKESILYKKVLVEKYKDVPEIAKICKHRFLPKQLKGEMRNKNVHFKAEERKKEKLRILYDDEQPVIKN